MYNLIFWSVEHIAILTIFVWWLKLFFRLLKSEVFHGSLCGGTDTDNGRDIVRCRPGTHLMGFYKSLQLMMNVWNRVVCLLKSHLFSLAPSSSKSLLWGKRVDSSRWCCVEGLCTLAKGISSVAVVFLLDLKNRREWIKGKTTPLIPCYWHNTGGGAGVWNWTPL